MDSQHKLVALALAISGLALSQPALAGDDTCAGIDWKPKILEQLKRMKKDKLMHLR